MIVMEDRIRSSSQTSNAIRLLERYEVTLSDLQEDPTHEGKQSKHHDARRELYLELRKLDKVEMAFDDLLDKYVSAVKEYENIDIRVVTTLGLDYTNLRKKAELKMLAARDAVRMRYRDVCERSNAVDELMDRVTAAENTLRKIQEVRVDPMVPRRETEAQPQPGRTFEHLVHRLLGAYQDWCASFSTADRQRNERLEKRHKEAKQEVFAEHNLLIQDHHRLAAENAQLKSRLTAVVEACKPLAQVAQDAGSLGTVQVSAVGLRGLYHATVEIEEFLRRRESQEKYRALRPSEVKIHGTVTRENLRSIFDSREELSVVFADYPQ